VFSDSYAILASLSPAVYPTQYTASIMSEAEAKTDAPVAAEEKSTEELKATKRAAEVRRRP